jgi:anaerobic C4-dicarboxylate transporter
MIVCIESCLFGVFVSSLLVDQLQSIVNDRTYIETLKSDENNRSSTQALPAKRILFRKVFGSGSNSDCISIQ